MAVMRLAMTMAALGVLVLGVLLWFHPDTGATLRPMLRDLFTTQEASGWSLVHQYERSYAKRQPGEKKKQFINRRIESLKHRAIELSKQYPNDWQLPLAATLLEFYLQYDGIYRTDYWQLWEIDQLYALCMRFPDRPEIAATLLRYAGYISLRDPIMPIRFPGNRVDLYLPRQIKVRRARLARLAERMEQVDPQNAFFPQMRACLLAGLGRKEEAFAVWQHAARQQRWDDYLFAEVEAMIHLADRLGEVHSAMILSSSLVIQYRHLSPLYVFHSDFAIPRVETLYSQGRTEVADELLLACVRNATLMMTGSAGIAGMGTGNTLLQSIENTFVSSKAVSPQLLGWVQQLNTQWTPFRSVVIKRPHPILVRLIEDTNRSLQLYRLASQRLAAGLILLALALSLGLMMRLRVPAYAIPLLLIFFVVLPLLYWLSQCAMASNLKGVGSIEVDWDASQVSTTGTPSFWEQIIKRITRFLTLNFDPIPSWSADVIVLWIGLVIITLLLILLRLWLWKRADNLWLFVQRSFFWLAIVMFLGAGATLWQYGLLERRLQSEWRELLTNETRYCAHRLGVPVPPIPPLPTGY
jgi:hypothetical protein